MDDEPNLYNQKSFCLTKSSLKTAEGQHKDTTNGCRWAIESRNNQAHSTYFIIWVFPKIGVPQNGWFIREILIKMDDLGVPLFSETSISSYFKLLKFQVFPRFFSQPTFSKWFTFMIPTQEHVERRHGCLAVPWKKGLLWGVGFLEGEREM